MIVHRSQQVTSTMYIPLFLHQKKQLFPFIFNFFLLVVVVVEHMNCFLIYLFFNDKNAPLVISIIIKSPN